MNIKLKIIDESLESQYDQFLLNNKNSLFFASNKYRKFIKDFLKAEDNYFVALDKNNKIIGALPCFIIRNTELGNLINSLPFFGSNGGIITVDNNEEILMALINAYYKFAENNNCVASTIISSPLDTLESFYEQTTSYTYKNTRIGQFTPLPGYSEKLNDVLMTLLHSKTRNLVRKAKKLEISVHDEQCDNYLDFLIKTHKENMEVIGGMAKPGSFFRLIPQYFNYIDDYKIYTAKIDGKLIAALLLFYYNKTVEYYTPVVKAKYRNTQALSLIIFEAMKDSTKKGFKWWNWGGTWTSQEGVYHFKSRWGTVDKPYYYYTRIFDKSILRRSKSQLLEAYPYFFVAPFDELL